MDKTSCTEVLRWMNCLESFSNLECPRFLKPYHLATLAVRLLKNNNTIVFSDKRLESYAKRMGLLNTHKIQPLITSTQKPSSKDLLEITSILNEEDTFSGANKLAEIIENNSFSPDESTRHLTPILSELLGNCYAHSKTKLQGSYGFACAQAWKKGKLAQIAIIDDGIGIRESLDENPALKGRLLLENACKMASEYAVSSKLGKNHSGYGLTLARDVLKQNAGNLIVISGREIYQCLQGSEICHNKDYNIWQGTLVIFEWNTHLPFDISAVYSSWPNPEGFDDEDFF